MSRGDPSREIPGDPRIPPSYTAPNTTNTTTTTNPLERQTSMSVGYLTRNPHSRDHPTYDLANQNYIYAQPLLQQHHNMQQQHPQREVYERAGPVPAHAATSVSGASSTPSSSAQQTPRITLPPLSAITENQETQSEGAGAQSAQTGQPSTNQAYPQHQQPSPSSQTPTVQHPTSQTSQQSSQQPSTYSSRAPSQYEPQQSPYSHPQRHLQPSPQLPPDQSRYSSGPVISSQVPLQTHQMPVSSLQPTQQMGQYPSPSPSSSQFQYNYQQSQYPPPQPTYGGYIPHQMATQMPPGIPYQPAYATSHRQRPPQFSPYPPPPSSFPPPQTTSQSWPQQDYIAQPLTPLPGHSQQQPYSPNLQQIPGGPGGPMRVRRPSSGLPGQPPYPPPGAEQPQAPSQSQPQLKPKRKRATSHQLKTLNDVFASTFFPSTELRIALGKQLNMSPRTVQIWFQNKRQAWRANRAKQTGGSQTQTQSGGPAQPSGSYSGSGQYDSHPAKQEDHFGQSDHARMPSSAEESREEGMENDEDGGWRALRQAQQDNPDNRDYRSSGAGEDLGFDDDPHPRHR